MTREALICDSALVKSVRPQRNRPFKFSCSPTGLLKTRTGFRTIRWSINFAPAIEKRPGRSDAASKRVRARTITHGEATPRPRYVKPRILQGAYPTVHWVAYRLELQHPQRLHRLVIDAATKDGESAGISLVEPNGPACFALDSGVAAGPSLEISTDRDPAGASPHVRRQVLFWPHVREPVLLIHDAGTGRPIEIAHVEVHELATPKNNEVAQAASVFHERLVGPYMSKPTFAASFGAPAAI